ncbi:MAG: glycosyltransferase family 2 protein, partial [Bacteroidales bacterium]|nr:glycosyltransferase family 2 protein [Bacteroidales bacterium]
MTVYIAIPVMDEKEYLPLTLDCIVRQQCEAKVKVFICVNQPDDWWNQVDKRIVCTNNQETIRLLDNYPELDIELIDKSSRGKGWSSGKQGVGCARKALSDAVLSKASDNDILISMDADTIFEPTYCQSILTNFRLHKTAVGIAVPYCHPIADEEPKDRAMLRYEIYTRNYNLNLLRIGSPYAYTALGSAIACTIKACRAVGGFDTQKSGEDFYFLQKLCKYGTILRHNTDKVYPSVRFSSRVPFGTGPAIYRGSLGKWEAYPVFHHSGFDIVRDTYRQLDRLFLEDIDNEFTAFLQTIFSTSDLWTP